MADRRRPRLTGPQICPFAQRVALALEETRTQYKAVSLPVDKAKPNWYTDQHHPLEHQVPAIYDASAGIEHVESVSLIQLVGGLGGRNSPRLPLSEKGLPGTANDVQLIYSFCMRISPGWVDMLRGNAAYIPGLFDNLAHFFNDVLPGHGTLDAATGQGSIGFLEAGIAPFVGRVVVLAKHGVLGGETGKRIYEDKFLGEQKWARARTWWAAVEASSSWQKTFDESAVVEAHRIKFAR